MPSRQHTCSFIDPPYGNRLLPRCRVIPEQVIQPSQLTSSSDTKIFKVLAPQSSHSLPGRDEPSNSPHTAGLAPVVREEELYVHDFRGFVGDMARQGGKAFYSVGPIEIERVVLDQPPSIVVGRVHDTRSPGPEDYNFSGVQTLKYFQSLDSRDDLCRRAKKLRPRMGGHVKHAAESGPPAFLCG